jgi:hemoglobin/transferrin/lactoferrin receptor protein
MYRGWKRRLDGSASALAMGVAAAGALGCALVGVGGAHAQQPQAEPVPPQGTILSPIVVKAPQNTGPSAPRSQPAPAAAAAAGTSPSSMDALSTASEKSAATVFDAPGTVTVKSTAEMERQNINSAREFVRDEPGISVGNQPGRTGATNFVIRGIGENRVRLEIDGVKVPDFPGTNSGAGTYTRDFIDYDALKRIEIVRGPASALYGSDALGGVVAFITKDPADYLDLVRKDWYFSIKGGYDSVDHSVYSTVTGAARHGSVDSLLLVTKRWGHEVAINSKTREANPQDYQTTNVLGKVVFNTYGAGQIRLTGEYFGKEVETTLNSESGVFPDQFARIFSGLGDDTTFRRRGSIDWAAPVDSWLADVIKAKLYVTNVHREEFTNQLRASYFGGPQPQNPTQRRLTDLFFDQQVIGAEVQASATRKWLGGEHFFTYGATVDRTETERLRDRSQITLSNGVIIKTVGGETFPNKNFPDTETTQAALYFQDIAQWGRLPGGAVRLFRPHPARGPAVRQLQHGQVPDPLPAGDCRVAQARRHIRPRPELSVVCAVRARLPGPALRQRQLRVPQHRLLLRDPAQRKSRAGDQRRLRGRPACALP